MHGVSEKAYRLFTCKYPKVNFSRTTIYGITLANYTLNICVVRSNTTQKYWLIFAIDVEHKQSTSNACNYDVLNNAKC